MNIYRINLNLLKVFAILMRERQVSAAAKCLHLTQPAISNSLQQLRELFADELFIRGTKKMVPTEKAMRLAPQIQQALTQLETSLFYADAFQHSTARRTFYLGMTDYAEYILLPKIFDSIQKIAPSVTLKVLNYNEFQPEDFENNRLELGISLEKKLHKSLRSERLYSDNSVCIARANHPIFQKPLTLERYLQAEHLATCTYSEQLSRADQALKKLNLQRNAKLTLPNALPAFQILATSNLVGTVSRYLALQAEKKYRLKFTELPFAFPDYHIAQVWHRQQEHDVGLIWLRGLIKDIWLS